MSDLDSVFDGLRGQGPQTPFEPPEAVRRRGRARKRRQVALAGAAVLVLTGGGGAVLSQTVPSPQPPVAGPLMPGVDSSAATSPADPDPALERAEEADWVLTEADLGPGWRAADHELLEGPWYWGECDAFPLEAVESLQQQTYVDAVSFLHGDIRLSQVLERFATPRDAAANLRDVQNYLNQCADPSMPVNGASPFHDVLINPYTAGDDSFLIFLSILDHGPDGQVPTDVTGARRPGPAHSGGHEEFVAVILVGDVVITLISTDLLMVRDSVPIAVERLP